MTITMKFDTSAIEIDLPLPPSKNDRITIVRGRPKVTRAVKKYREAIGYMVARHKGRFEPGEKIILECVWRKANGNQDCANFHDELLDAIFPGLGLNDKHALIRDMDFTVEPKNPGVTIQIRSASRAVSE